MSRRAVDVGAEKAEGKVVAPDVREGILAENGVAGTTVRSITAEAGANVAAVNYYFRTKEELYREVVGRRLGPLNEERARLLAHCLKRGGKRPSVKDVLPVKDVLRAFAEPGHELPQLLRRGAARARAG